jgi:hypothetical protein
MSIDEKEDTYLGEMLNYASFIRPPTDPAMKFTDGGKRKELAHNINGITAYVDLLISGDSKASKRVSEDGKYLPLGGKYFMKTILKCKDVDSGNEVDRYVYMNNIPTGRLPFTTGTETSYKGIVPGMMGNVEKMSPFEMIDELFSSSVPKCKKVNLEIVSNTSDKGQEKARHVSLDDLETLLERKEHINSYTNDAAYSLSELNSWKEGFENILTYNNRMTDMYFLSLLLISFYIFYCIMRNRS